ncbi:CHAT domain-containing protein [Crucibulum laeve]|uniref:CHAT domain-containing protein n=1 Tax=Crucibulum laeve TaxID=68775 RepID=A0A5C3LPU4_9AGAR|nr:CHAT domain-containing protein [Crucibulum laeve]
MSHENSSSLIVTTESTSPTHVKAEDSNVCIHNIRVESHSPNLIAESGTLAFELITLDQSERSGDVYYCYSTSSTTWKCPRSVKVSQQIELLGFMLYVNRPDGSIIKGGHIFITKRDLSCDHGSAVKMNYPSVDDSEPRKTQLSFMYHVVRSEPSAEEECHSPAHEEQLKLIEQNLDEYYLAALDSPDDTPGKTDLLEHIGVSYRKRFTAYHENRDDIDKSVIALNMCMTHSPNPATYGNPLVLYALGESHQTRYDAFGDLQDLDKAISAHERAVNLIPQADPRLSRYLDRLGASYDSRFRHKEDLPDADEAISLFQRAAHLASDNPAILSNFATTLHQRFKRTRDLDDLNEAIRIQKNVLILVHQDDNDRSRMIKNLGTSLESRYGRCGDINDLTEAIENYREALRLIPEGHPAFIGCLNSLGCALQNKFQATNDLVDIDEAILLQKRVVSLNKQSHSDFPGHLSNLSNSFNIRFDVTRDTKDIEETIKVLQRAIDLVPDDNAIKCRFHFDLGISFLRNYAHLKEQNGSLLEQSMKQHRLATKLSAGAPLQRILAADKWAETSIYLGNKSQYNEAYTIAFDLVPRLVWIGQTISGRHQELPKITQVVENAATIAIYRQQYSLALQWLEQGRCIIRNQLSNLRTPVDDLHRINPDLSSELQRVGTALETYGHMETNRSRTIEDIDEISSQNDAVRRHRQLAKQWDELVEKTRQIHGFETFLKPISFSHLSTTIPDMGPVITLSGHGGDQGCHALVIMRDSDEVIQIRLDDFSYSKAEHLQRRLSQCLSSHRLRTREARLGRTHFKTLGSNDIYYILSQLWTCLVKPILDGLGYSPCDSSSPPRIWFCPTGPFTFLPIHAAGIYQSIDGVRGPIISDYVIASYTPTVSAIAKIAQESKHTAFHGMLSVSQPDLPDLPPIPSTSMESLETHKAFEALDLPSLRLDRSSASIVSVLEGMQSTSWVHLACHAVQDTSDPVKSGFYLQEGRLDFSTLIQKNFPHADFAFLSACQTSMGDDKLSEEAVHLASGMLSAGYRGVIATMWSISDEHAPAISKQVYSHLLKNVEPNCGPQSSEAVNALHYAIQDFRKEHGDDEMSLLSWVPFVHWGL